MHSRKPQALPKHPNWRLVRATSAKESGLTLSYGTAVLRIRFWPRASAALRLHPNDPWVNGRRHAKRLLDESLDQKCCHRIVVQDRVCLVDETGQLHFPFTFDPLKASVAERTQHAVLNQLSKVPIEIRKSLKQFHSGRWESLQLASRLKAAAELMLDHPQLFWLWVRRYRLQSPKSGHPQWLFCLKFDLSFSRDMQMSKLGFSKKKFWLRFLAKIPIRQMSSINWDGLGRFTHTNVNPKTLKLIQHTGRLPLAFIQSLADPRTCSLMNTKLVRSYFKTPIGDLYKLLCVVHKFRKEFPHAAHLASPPSNINQLENTVQRLDHIIDDFREYRGVSRTSPFPCPEGWKHLNTVELIADEGYQQHNCLFGDPGGFIEGDSLVYRVEKPVRATLEVKQYEPDIWHVSQCAGPQNSRIPITTQRQLLQTLKGEQALDYSKLPREEYPASPAESNPIYQRLGNSRALWSVLDAHQTAHLPPRLTKPLLAGEFAVYRVRHPQESVVMLSFSEEYGWDMHWVLYQSENCYTPSPYMAITHIVWQHYAELHEHGYEVPTWRYPDLKLEGFKSVTNIWELLRFRWQTGACISVADILEGKLAPFYCRCRGFDLAVVARTEYICRGDIKSYHARQAGILSKTAGYSATKDGIEVEIREALKSIRPPARDSLASDPPWLPPPKLPEVKKAYQLNNPEYYRVPSS